MPARSTGRKDARLSSSPSSSIRILDTIAATDGTGSETIILSQPSSTTSTSIGPLRSRTSPSLAEIARRRKEEEEIDELVRLRAHNSALGRDDFALPRSSSLTTTAVDTDPLWTRTSTAPTPRTTITVTQWESSRNQADITKDAQDKAHVDVSGSTIFCGIPSPSLCAPTQSCPTDATTATTATTSQQPQATVINNTELMPTSTFSSLFGGWFGFQGPTSTNTANPNNNNKYDNQNNIGDGDASAVTEMYDNRTMLAASRANQSRPTSSYFGWATTARDETLSKPAATRNLSNPTPTTIVQGPGEMVSPVTSYDMDWEDQLAQHMEDKLKLAPAVILEEDTNASEASYLPEDGKAKGKPQLAQDKEKDVQQPEKELKKPPQQEQQPSDSAILSTNLTAPPPLAASRHRSVEPSLQEPPLASHMRRQPTVMTKPRSAPLPASTQLPTPTKSTPNATLRPSRRHDRHRTKFAATEFPHLATNRPVQTKRFVPRPNDNFWSELVAEGVIDAEDLSVHSGADIADVN